MRRYLLFLGYSGTRLRGVQKQPSEGVTENLSSVQGHLDAALQKLRAANVPQAVISSRTDKGVHALQNSAHVDLCTGREGSFFTPDFISRELNKYFIKKETDIRIRSTREVPSRFHARYRAEGRSYLYRLAVLKPDVIVPESFPHGQLLPLAELHRTYLRKSPFDVEKVIRGCQLLEGRHNFATFMNTPSKSSIPVDPNRVIDSITITRGRPLLDPRYDSLYDNLEFWDINVSAKSFLYKQVRRFVGALVGLAHDRITLEDIQWMLDNPSPQNWNSKAEVAPAQGLYLLKVKYPSEVFEESYYEEHDAINKAILNNESCSEEDSERNERTD